jgi:hypothetical protein
MQQPKVAICLTTHNRIDCARISLEIIKYNFPRDWVIVHACSNPAYEKYLEDELIRCQPLPMTAGALNLLQCSIAKAVEAYQPDYLIHLEGDTWILDHQVLLRYIQNLDDNRSALVAASSWSIDNVPVWRWKWNVRRNPVGAVKSTTAKLLRRSGVEYGMLQQDTLSTQFFIAKNTPEWVSTLACLEPNDGYILENGFYKKIVERFGLAAIVGMPEREPLHPHFRWVCEALSLYGQHWPTTVPNPSAGKAPCPDSHFDVPGKRETLMSAPWLRGGTHMERLLKATDLGYYNAAAKRC